MQYKNSPYLFPLNVHILFVIPLPVQYFQYPFILFYRLIRTVIFFAILLFYRRLFPHARTPMKTNQQPKGNKKISCRPPVSVLLIKLVCFYLWYNELFLFSMSCAYTAYKKRTRSHPSGKTL